MLDDSAVLVVGAGPAGAAAGITAARAGARVTVLDRARFPRDKTCGDAVPNSAIGIIERLGARERLESAPHALVRAAVAVLPEGSRLVRDYGRHPGYIVPRLALDDLLRRALEDAGARVVEGVSARRIVGGRVVADTGEWRARVVIAADGPGSVAWSALERSPPRAAGLALATTAYVEGMRPAELADASEHYFERWLSAGYGWIFPAVDGIANVGVYQRADRYHRGGVPLAKLLDRFVKEHPERFDGARVLRVRTWSLPLATRALPLAAAGLLTAGDASRIIDPLTGEGIWHALRSGELAGATAASAARSGGLSRGAARRHALRVAREVSWPAAGRRLIQDAMSVIVERQLDESVWVRRALAAGYGGGAFEISKLVGD